MRRPVVDMSVDEYHLLPFEPGWKCEYWDGKVHYSPRHHAVVTSISVAARDLTTDCLLRLPAESDLEALTSVYTGAFHETIEYFECSRAEVSAYARRDLLNYFAGEHGRPTSASCLAVYPGLNEEQESIAGAALVTARENGPRLFLLFVAPQWQRRGLATAMVSAAINELDELGESILTSRYHIGNEQSMAWHQHFGFREEPDLKRANLYLKQARVELWRSEKRGGLTAEERAKLADAVTRWETEVEELERLQEEKGFGAVDPLLRW